MPENQMVDFSRYAKNAKTNIALKRLCGEKKCMPFRLPIDIGILSPFSD
jgi:hypothetical protein